MEISVEWILGSFVALVGALTAMAKLFYTSLSDQIKTSVENQIETIDNQNVTIKNLQDSVDRLSRGCGSNDCLWSFRKKQQDLINGVGR